MCSCALFRSVVTMNAQCICRWLLSGGLPLVLPSACLFFSLISKQKSRFRLLKKKKTRLNKVAIVRSVSCLNQ